MRGVEKHTKFIVCQVAHDTAFQEILVMLK